jgi:hypothetical protein
MITRRTKTKRTAKRSERTTITKDGPKIVTVTRTKMPKGTLTQTHIKYVHSDEPQKSKI